MRVTLAGPAARAQDGSFVGTKRLRRLREHEDEKEVGGAEYETRLRRVFESLHPRPAWAEPLPPASGPSSSLSQLLSRAGSLVARPTGRKPRTLPATELDVQRARDANMVAQQEGEAASVECMDWHPSARVRILMTASRDRTVRLFEIDGNSNPLLQSLHVPSLPLTYAAFHPSGSSVLLAGPRPYLYAYDLQSGRALRSTPWRGLSNDGNTAERDLSMARFQPLGAESGRLLAIGGRRGAIHLLDWGSGQGGAGAGAGAALVGSLRLNAPLVGLEWDQTASAAGRRLLSLSKEGSVHVWDTRAMRCAVERRDAGLFGAHGLAQSPSGAHWAVGSDSGTVNVYDALTASEVQDNKPWASVKELGNLVTRTTTLSWNHDGQMLAVASRNKKDALKLVHAPSLRVFANWPTAGTPLGHVTDVRFSGASEYAAVANSRGRVLLYSLRHYVQ
ncbi:WD40 repeat-like protein [Tilletiopsis washingtonensis]|uniref:WD40 repeat-like protein n=1 Tax=Tilletiopsis washingtonensis TaxID=58919 RepID=A0A316ZFZ3_9BASI|nr:WD40 repeat-like protein [Tilletiopsis washingtonensis]PWO00157.1 WD40 repeat-like protein [Tilletiopsis washingtonensis]